MSIKLYDTMMKSGHFDSRSNNYVWVRDMEWINPTQTDKYSGKVPEGVVPIAITAAGDIWGINENAIILYCHDDAPMFYADSLINAIFRAIIEYLSDNDFVSVNVNDENNADYAKGYLKKCINVFSEWFSSEQKMDIEKISENNIREFHYNNGTAYHSFISIDEADMIIKKYINCNDDSKEYANDNVSNDRLVFSDCFSDEMINELRCHCKKNSVYYLKSGEQFNRNISADNNLSQFVYKGRVNDLFLYRIGDIFTDGSFYTGVKKKSGSEVKGSCTEYFVDKNGTPVYAKLYADGNMNPHYGICFYFVSDNSVISSKYSYDKDKNDFRYYDTTENTFAPDGKILSFIKYDESSVRVAEYYLYTNGILTESRCIEIFSFNDEIGRIPDDMSLEGFRENPLSFSKNIYIYKDDAIVGVHKIKCDDDGCKCYDFKVTDKIYKEIMKRKLI